MTKVRRDTAWVYYTLGAMAVGGLAFGNRGRFGYILCVGTMLGALGVSGFGISGSTRGTRPASSAPKRAPTAASPLILHRHAEILHRPHRISHDARHRHTAKANIGGIFRVRSLIP